METSAVSNRILFAESHTTLGQPEFRRQPFRRCFRWHPQARCECRRLLPLLRQRRGQSEHTTFLLTAFALLSRALNLHRPLVLPMRKSVRVSPIESRTYPTERA